MAVTVPSFSAALAIVARTDLVATLPDDVVRSLAPDLVRFWVSEAAMNARRRLGLL